MEFISLLTPIAFTRSLITMASFSKGDTFTTFSEVEEKVKEYEKTKFVQLWKRDTRKLETAQKRFPNKVFKPDLVYYELQYRCINGGRTFKSRSAGDRPKQCTFRQDCQFLLKLRATNDGNNLEVVNFCEQHNHMISEGEYQHLSSQRCISRPGRDQVKEMLKVDAKR